MFVMNEGTLEVPASWKDETINMLTTVRGGGSGLSFTISRDTLPWGMGFASFAKKEIDALAASLKEYRQLAHEPVEVDGREAVMSEFRWMSAQGPIHQCMVITARDQRALVFTASMQGLLSEEQKHQVLALIATFRFSQDSTEAVAD